MPEVNAPVFVNGTETVAPPQNGEPVIVPVVKLIPSAKAKNKDDPETASELLIEVPLTVPFIVLYDPANVAELAIALNVPNADCLVNETELFVKFPVVATDQYSVELMLPNGATAEPPEFVLNASTVAVTAPAPVVGFTNDNGK